MSIVKYPDNWLMLANKSGPSPMPITPIQHRGMGIETVTPTLSSSTLTNSQLTSTLNSFRPLFFQMNSVWLPQSIGTFPNVAGTLELPYMGTFQWFQRARAKLSYRFAFCSRQYFFLRFQHLQMLQMTRAQGFKFSDMIYKQ